ncbi:hypothetical protein [Secundilactobacillus similis]|uniref:N-acetyltransferase domain-containing protein n=1 Tax=Secundilactobacillus similis DSM 23365 = JCM 2765 TaxID=1423804 RepID=A0A0R2EH62_9LACO|nr:hypothetical protein [Secundilactobacillus similis]KRN15614.1 hypothetical protein FD14_GL002958 [Secundilactobacillus similis DSM 23365 = JCM 2765]
MAKFELYHPILTPHYRLDWLTQFTVKDVNALRQQRFPNETLLETATYINREMSTVMHDQALTWGIQDKVTEAFNGSATLSKTDDGLGLLSLTLTTDADRSALIHDLVTYMNDFSRSELGATQFAVQADNADEVLTSLGFNYDATHNYYVAA